MYASACLFAFGWRWNVSSEKHVLSSESHTLQRFSEKNIRKSVDMDDSTRRISKFVESSFLARCEKVHSTSQPVSQQRPYERRVSDAVIWENMFTKNSYTIGAILSEQYFSCVCLFGLYVLPLLLPPSLMMNNMLFAFCSFPRPNEWNEGAFNAQNCAQFENNRCRTKICRASSATQHNTMESLSFALNA